MSSAESSRLPRVRLVMHQARIRRVDDPVTGLPRLHAQHDVAERQPEALVVAAQPLEHVAAHHLAGAGHREIVPVAVRRAEQARGRPRRALAKRYVRRGRARTPRRHAGSSDPDRAASRRRRRLPAAAPSDQLVEPVGLDHLDVVVQEQQQLTPGRAAPALHAAEKLNGRSNGTIRAAPSRSSDAVQLEHRRVGACRCRR